MYSLILSYERTDIAFIYNPVLDKVYYIHFSKKEISDTNNPMLPVLEAYIESIDEEKLKRFLVYGEYNGFVAPKVPGSVLYIPGDETIEYEQIQSWTILNSNNDIEHKYSTTDIIVDADTLSSGATDFVYGPPKTQKYELDARFGIDSSVYMEVATGVMASGNISLKSMKVTDKFRIEFDDSGDTFFVEVAMDGGPIDVKHGYPCRCCNRARKVILFP